MDREPSASPSNRTRRFDPRRRDRIIASALDVIAEVGVAGTTHRLIAKAAEVPLGSMTYHFENLESVIWCAFEKFASDLQASVENHLRDIPANGDVIQGIMSLVERGTPHEQKRDTVLTMELYILAIRDEKYGELVQRWIASTRAAFANRFSALHLEVVDALIEGFLIHRTFSGKVPSKAELREAFCALGGGQRDELPVAGSGRRAK